MIAGKDYPDLIYVKGTEMNQLVQADALMDLTPMIEKYGSNIKKLYGKYLNRLQYNINNKAIYALSSGGVDNEKWEPSMGFELQHAVVTELGFPKIETLEDFENAIKAYKEKKPTIDGKPTIGLSLIADDWRWQVSVGNGAGFATGAPDDGNFYIDPKTYKAEFRFTREPEKEYFRWLNHMNDIGLLDPDSFVQKYDQYLSKIASGRVLGLIDAKWEYSSGEDRLKADGKVDRTYGMYPVQLNSNYKCAEFRGTGYTAGWGVSITSSCKDPERAIKFLDWMCTDEAHILRYWGIEGVNYKVENGKRVQITTNSINSFNKDYKKNTGIEVYAYPFPSWGIGKKDATGQLYIPTSKESIEQKYSDSEKAVLSAYGKKTWAELYPTESELQESPWGYAFYINIPADSDLTIILQKCGEIMKTKLPKAILCKPSEFDGIWAGIMQDLKKAGVDKANEELTDLVKQQIELWK
jgi:putative aldouronate transport system substrate-binding protein